MINLILSTLFACTPIDATRELNPQDLIECIGKSIQTQKIFPPNDLMLASGKILETYLGTTIKRTLDRPRRYALFGIAIDELHITLDTLNKVTAILVRLENKNIVEKMKKEIGNEYMAASFGGDDAPFTSFM